MKPARKSESGYALLFVLMTAAVIGIMLYRQIPSVAFEAQRDREQRLIDRGEQYKRAIQLYVRKFNRFPPDIAALESSQNIRFLRKQYTDPMTGKNEWRLIHVGPAGQLTDSLVTGTQQKGQGSAPQTFITEMQGVGGAGETGATQGINLATRRRPEDGPGSPGSPGDPNNPGGLAGGPVMVLPDGRIVPATLTGIPAATGPTGLTGPNALNGAGASPLPGQPGFGQPGQLPPGFQTTPNDPNAPPANAASLINQILTTPRPGGLNGNGPYQPAGATTATLGGPQPGNTGVPAAQLGGTTIGGGVAGVASKLEQEGIKVYNDQTDYHKWEFVYDMSKDKTRAGGVNPAQPNGNTNPNGNPMNGNPLNGPSTNPFGQPGNQTPGPTPPPPPPTTGTSN